MRPLLLVLALTVAPACLPNLDGLTGGCQGTCDAGGTDGGTPDAQSGCSGTRGPTSVRVTVGERSFCIDSTEVTRGQYAEFLAATDGGVPGNEPNPCKDWKKTHVPSGWTQSSTLDKNPVNNVDWCDAYAFCKWAGKELCGSIEGGQLLPNEINNASVSAWYAACSHGGERLFPYGSEFKLGACVDADLSPITDVASFKTCEGGYPGLFDMVGNLEEWVDACENDTKDGSCLSRGGNHTDDTQVRLGCQAAGVTSEKNDFQDRDSFGEWQGFRCCSH